ncbi:ABC-type transport system involved in resistance to organic solvents [Collimonas arenae]|uniref:ABC-type transport system involved in resistance to organic solvents n=1 Tax=Collimonas arenae TaxID=279058 RepID=A0A0A1FH93_9BURK|nr:MlaD family protein [Collimonas arenae]AIY43951.1 ABC-type transport system involved in resistance to organic solvents [Collimonas arenae]
MENKAHALIAGLFTVVLLIAAIVGVMWFNSDRVERVPYEIATKLSVPGLNPQADVRYRGLDAGKVDAITFDPKFPGQILIKIKLNPDTPVTQSTFATLGYQGVTGIAYIQLDDDGSKPVKLVSSKQQLARIELRPSLFDNLQSRGSVILARAEDMINKLNALLDPENQKTMVKAFSDVSDTANAYRGIPQQLEPTLRQLPTLTGELNQALTSVTALSNNMSVLSKNLNSLTASLQGPDGAVTNLTGAVQNIGSVANGVEYDTLPRFNTLTNEMRSSMRTLNQTLDHFNQQPQSILFGSKPLPPGPGEAGFVAPAK